METLKHRRQDWTLPLNPRASEGSLLHSHPSVSSAAVLELGISEGAAAEGEGACPFGFAVLYLKHARDRDPLL